MAFLMQGWGQFFNQVILIVLLLVFHAGKGGPPYSERVAQWTFRVSFAIPAVGTLWLVCKYFVYFHSRFRPRPLPSAISSSSLKVSLQLRQRTSLDKALF